jgi:protein N-lysine methyltransferase METTL21A
MMSSELIVRPSTNLRDETLAIVASGMPQGRTSISLTPNVGEESLEEESSCVEVHVLNFPFQDHGVGGVLWPAAVVLSHHIAQRERKIKILSDKTPNVPTRVLELGAGSAALGGLASAICLGANVVVTDLPEILKLTRRTLSENTGNVEKYGGSISSFPLVWGEPLPIRLLKHRFNIIVGADLLYRNELHDALLTTLRDLCKHTTPTTHEVSKQTGGAEQLVLNDNLLSSKGEEFCQYSDLPLSTRVLLSFRVRHPEEESCFFAKAAREGFVVSEVSISDLSMLTPWQKDNHRIVQLTPGW